MSDNCGMKKKCKNNISSSQRNLNHQILNVLPIILEVIILIFQVICYLIFALYHLIIPRKLKPINNDIVLITGAAHGIGRELVLQYAKEGCTVICWDINLVNLELLAEEVVGNGYPKPYIFKCDVSNREEVLKTAKKVQELGMVGILINNAGIMPAHALEDHTPDEIKRIMDVNVLAHFWTIEAFLPEMKSANHGHIVGISSLAGIVGVANLIPYCASKFAVRGLMETLHEELRLNPQNRIKTTVIFPYMVDTGLCKVPEIKFKKSLAMLQPNYVAEKIIEAQRTDQYEACIPKYLYYVNALCRLFPTDALEKIKDFINSGVLPDP